jgi:hypothetical protein
LEKCRKERAQAGLPGKKGKIWPKVVSNMANFLQKSLQRKDKFSKENVPKLFKCIFEFHNKFCQNRPQKVQFLQYLKKGQQCILFLTNSFVKGQMAILR